MRNTLLFIVQRLHTHTQRSRTHAALTRNIQIYEKTRTYVAAKSIRIGGANTVTLKENKHRYVALAKSTHVWWRPNGCYDVQSHCIVLLQVPGSRIHTGGVPGCEGPRVIWVADHHRAKLLIAWSWLVHRCRTRSRQIFGGAKDFCPNFPECARKSFLRQSLPYTFSLTNWQKIKFRRV